MVSRHVDLRKEEQERSNFGLNRRAALVVTFILAVSGIGIALIVPELTGSEIQSEGDPYSTPLSVLLSSTIERVDTEEMVFTHVTVPVAYYILLREEEQNLTGIDALVSEYLTFILEDDAFRFTISSGSGWDEERSHDLSSSTPPSGTSTISNQEVVVDMEKGKEITVLFILEVWGVEKK